jgi:hypothetical protein
VALRVTGELGLQCGGEAKVSFERIGTKVTSAVGRPGPSVSKVAVTLSFKASCWAASGLSFSVGPGPHNSKCLLSARKKLRLGRER